MLVAPIDLVPFLCKATGRCCIHNLVILSSFDIFRIGKTLGASAKELFTKKLITYRINPSNFWMEPILNSRTNSTCPFLFREVDANTEQYLCEIYESRPLVCRIYPLKYDKDNSVFMRFLPAEHRCFECITTENNPTLEDYLNTSNVNELLEEFNQYLALLDRIFASGMNLEKIKKNKTAQKKFFEIQSILYETYPEKENTLDKLPFEEMESRVNEILDKTEFDVKN